MIKLDIRLLIILSLFISSCSSLELLKQSYKNFSAPLVSESYVVQPGDSIWSISINLNIYPKQTLALSGNFSKIHPIKKPEAITWHHPLGQVSKVALKDDSWLIFKEPKGLPIHSIHIGKVVVSGPDIPGYGNLVMISHPDGYLSLYAHCDKIFVEQGDDVGKGTMIAHLGNSEAAYPMLRFQLRKNGKPVNADKLDSLF